MTIVLFIKIGRHFFTFLIFLAYYFIGIYKHKFLFLEYFILDIDKEVEIMSTNSCIKNLLKLICLLQKNSLNTCVLDEGCTKPYLGPVMNNLCYNTRVLTLYKKNGEIFEASYEDENGNINNSSLFRIQNVSDDCATLLILNNENGEYYSTGQFITIKISCICAIRCLEDVALDNLCERRFFNE